MTKPSLFTQLFKLALCALPVVAGCSGTDEGNNSSTLPASSLPETSSSAAVIVDSSSALSASSESTNDSSSQPAINSSFAPSSSLAVSSSSQAVQQSALDRNDWLLSASHNEPNLALAIDDDISTRWDTDQRQQAGQWLAVDLGGAFKLSAITLDCTDSPNDYPVNYDIQVSNDGVLWQSIVTRDGNAAITHIQLANVAARHVKIVQGGLSDQYYWSIHELNAYGETDDNPPLVELPPILLPSPASDAVSALKAHLNGEQALSAAQLANQQTAIEANLSTFQNNIGLVDLVFDVVELYDQQHGALFTAGSKTDGGISRSAGGLELERALLSAMQAVLDHSYTEQNIAAYPSVFGRKFATSDYFPGAVAAPEISLAQHSTKVNGTHLPDYGIPANYVTMDARRPTGAYLAPGSIATIDVPQSLVGINASILVGAHTWDLSSKTTIKRMDRVTKRYPINSTQVAIANPLGGGIYINIPYEQDLGILDITLNNVVRSPYWANTAANKTQPSQWLNSERKHPAPWADFESDKVMMQVPSSWIYNMDAPTNMMADWDLSMDALSELFSRPLVRAKTVVYQQVDVIMRGSANFPGYPQSNITYDPDRDYGGNHNHFLTRGPRGQTGYFPSVFFHEQGHAENFHMYSGEHEAVVNFLWVAVHNKKFGVDLQTAFRTSRYNFDHTIERAAQTWMIAENFREGNRMSQTAGQYQNEFHYQPRGYAKYADIVRMFGWQALEQFHANGNDDYENGIIPPNGNKIFWDNMAYRLSVAAGYDLRPLLHFWGMNPNAATDLANRIADANLLPSSAIYDQLLAYKEIVPMSNQAFRDIGLHDYTEGQITSFVNPFPQAPRSYYEGFLNAWWGTYNSSHGQAARDQIDRLIALYFPNGRPVQ